MQPISRRQPIRSIKAQADRSGWGRAEECGMHVRFEARNSAAIFLTPGMGRSSRTGWLGREGSNLRMPESKSGALPLGDAPAGRPGINQPGRGANPAKWPEGRHFCPVAGGGGHRYKGASRGEGAPFRNWHRRVAQPGRALRSGRRGRRFESSLSDHFPPPIPIWRFDKSPAGDLGAKTAGTAGERSERQRGRKQAKACFRNPLSPTIHFLPVGQK